MEVNSDSQLLQHRTLMAIRESLKCTQNRSVYVFEAQSRALPSTVLGFCLQLIACIYMKTRLFFIFLVNNIKIMSTACALCFGLTFTIKIMILGYSFFFRDFWNLLCQFNLAGLWQVWRHCVWLFMVRSSWHVITCGLQHLCLFLAYV